MSASKVSGDTGKFTAECSDPRQAFGGILAAWLRTTFGRGASKQIQNSLNVSRSVAEQALDGHVSIDTLMLMIVVWQEPFVDGVINPMIRPSKRKHGLLTDVKNLEMQIASMRDQMAALNEEVVRLGLFDSGEDDPDESRVMHDLKNRVIRKIYEISRIIPGLKYNHEHDIHVDDHDDAKVFSGKVLQHEELCIDQISSCHAKMLKVYNECDGYLTDAFADQLIASKIGPAVSIYDEQIIVRRIGSGTVFWTEEQRRALIGRSICELPGPKDYVSLAYHSLQKTVLEQKPRLYLVGFKAGSIEAYYDRVAFPFPKSGLVVGSPCPKKVTTLY